MKSKKFQYLLKIYIFLFSILVLVSLGLAINHIINDELSEMFSLLKSCSTFMIFLLIGLNYKKIEHWLKLHLEKQKG